MPEPLVDAKTAAEYLGRRTSWLLDRWADLGIPAYKVGNGLRFRISELDEWIVQQRAQPPAPQPNRRKNQPRNP